MFLECQVEVDKKTEEENEKLTVSASIFYLTI